MSGDRWYRVLLRLLPFDFRADYGDELTRAFREQRGDAAAEGRGRLLRVWWENIMALLSVGPREHAAQLGQDVRYALRGLRRSPGFVAVAVATLGLGTGANVAMFAVVHAVVLRPLPYAEPARLVSVWNTWTGSQAARLSNPEYLDYAERSRTLDLAAATSAALNVSGGSGDAERVPGAWMTVNGLRVLGVAPLLGRGFRPDDEQGEGHAVLLSHGFWRRRFGANPGIVGARLTVNGSPREVAGVLPEGFLLPTDFTLDAPADVVLPLALDRAAARNRRGGHYLQAFGRLAPGATPASAAAEMQAILAPLVREYPEEHDQGDFAIAVRPLRDDLLGPSRDILLTLAGAVVLVLLLACANVANLVLARGETRRGEIAVRAALGASRLRVARQWLTESFVLAAVGAAAGLLIAVATGRAVAAIGGTVFPRLGDLRLDPAVLAFASGLALIAGGLFGAAPALQLSRPDAGAALNAGSSRVTDGRSRLRRALVVSQVALAIVLVVAAGLLIKSFVRLTRVPAGIDASNVLTMRVSLPAARYPGRPEIAAFFSRALDRIGALPGVRTAGAASGLPLAVASGDWGFDIEGRARVGSRPPGAADWYVVTPGYFEALSIPLVRGRLPAAGDTEDAPHVVFVNESTARALFPAGDAVGVRIRMSRSTGGEQPWRTIAGVVGDVRQRGLDTPPRTEIYFPYRQFQHFSAGAQARAMSIVVKAGVEPAALAAGIRPALRALDAEVPVAEIRTMDDVVSASVTDRRLNALLIGAFGALALLLAAIGVYGVMAFTVTQRTREIGVRMALGASRGSVLSLVVGQGLRLVAGGIAIGIAGALAAAGGLAHLLFDVDPRDATILALAPIVLLLAGALASYVPARRAMRVDPVRALRGS